MTTPPSPPPPEPPPNYPPRLQDPATFGDVREQATQLADRIAAGDEADYLLQVEVGRLGSRVAALEQQVAELRQALITIPSV